MTKNIPLLYGFSFFDQFMIVIALWVPYLATQGIGMRQFMELQAVFAIVILSDEVPSGLGRPQHDFREATWRSSTTRISRRMASSPAERASSATRSWRRKRGRR